MSSKLEAKGLPCVCSYLSKDSQLLLSQCEVKENQRWRHASVKRLTEMAEYSPELSSLLNSLENYSLCEKHYNQIVRSSFVKMKSKVDDSSFLDSEEGERKRRKLTDASNDCGSSDFGVQVSLPDPEYEMFLKRIDKLESLNQQLLSENETLRRLLDERLTDEQDRVKLVTEIAKMERRNVYDDITSLMKNQDRFGLDNLLEYSPSKMAF